MEIDDRQASQIHGIISSDSDSDYNSRDFDDEYYSLKPPPLDYQSIKDKIVVICREQGTNVWDQRFNNLEKDDDETIIGVASSVRVLTKKKKKKSKTKIGNGPAAVSCKKVQIQLPVLKKRVKKKTQSKPEQSTVKGSSSTVLYDPQTLKKVEEKISDLKSVWHCGLNDTIIQQEFSLQRQRESSMYDLWMKSAGVEIKPNKTKKKQEKSEVSEKKTEKKSKQPVVQKKSSAYDIWMKLAGIKPKSKETKKQQANTVKNEKKTKKKSKQPVVEPSSTNLAKKGKVIKKNTPKKKAAQTLKNSKDNNTPESTSTSPVDFWWNYDTLVNDQSRLLSGFTNDTKNDTKFNKVKATANTATETEKKVGVKKTWAELFEKPQANMTKQKSQVKTNIETAKKPFYDEEKWNLQLFGTEIIKNEIPVKDETLIDAQNSNFGLGDKETVQRVWYYNNFNFNDTQYFTNFSNDAERDSRPDITIAVDLTTKTKKKKRSKKKSKQSVDILTNESLLQNSEVNLGETMPEHVKETWEMSYEERKSREIIENEGPEKETQIVQKSNGSDAQNSNFVLLDKDTLRNAWRFDNFVDEQISCFAYYPNDIENDTGFNIDKDNANSTPKTKKRTRSKKKPKKSVDNLANQIPDGNDYTHSKEILDGEEKLNPQLLDEHLIRQMWFLPNNIDTKLQLATEIQEEIRNEDFNLKDTNQDDASAVPKPKTKKKKKKQSTAEPPPIEVGHDTEKTSEDTVAYRGITRENWDFNSANLQGSINNNKEMTFGHTATSEEPRRVFGDDFKDFIRNICCEDSTIISNLNSFNYEQLERSYLAYRERNFKDTNQEDVSAPPKSKKKKKPKQSTTEPPLNEVSHDTERTSGNPDEYHGITRENCYLNSKNLQVSYNKEMTFKDRATSEEPQQVSGEDFIRNICCKGVANISNLKDTNQVDVSATPKSKNKRKKKKPQHSATEPPLNEVGHDTKRTSENTVEHHGITRENWDLNSEMTYKDTATSEEPQQVSGEDFIGNICRKGVANISNLNSFSVEESYLAYRERKNATKHLNAIANDVTMKSNSKKSNIRINSSNSTTKTQTVCQRTKKTVNDKPILTDSDRLLNSLPDGDRLLFSLTGGERLLNSLTDGDRLLNSLTGGDRFLNTLTESDKHLNSLTAGDRILNTLTESYRHPNSLTGGERLFNSLTDGDRHLNSLTDDDRFLNTLTDGDKHLNSLTAGDRNLNNLTESYRHLNSLSGGDRFVNTLTDGDRHLNSLTAGDRNLNNLTESYRHLNSLSGGDRFLNTLTDGDKHLNSLTAGDRILNSLTESYRHSNSLTGSDRYLNSLTDDYRLLSSLTERNDSFHPTNYHKHQKTDTNFDVTGRNPKNGTVIDPSTESAGLNPEDGAKTSVSLPQSSQIEEKRSINNSTIVLKANSATNNRFNGTSTASKDFNESFAVFSRAYNDALGYDHISTYNADYYKKLYRVLHKWTNNSANDTKKTADDKPMANDSTRGSDRLLHYLTRSNDGLKSKSQVTSTYRTSTADSWCRDSDYRERIVSNQNVRSVAPFSRGNQDFYGHSSRYEENYRRERDLNENFGSVSHTMDYNRLGDLSNDRCGDKTDDNPLPSALFYVFIIVMVAIAVTNIIGIIVSFLYNNIFFVGLLFLVFMKFKS